MFSNFSVLYRGVKFLLWLWSFTTLQTYGSSVLSYLMIIILKKKRSLLQLSGFLYLTDGAYLKITGMSRLQNATEASSRFNESENALFIYQE